MRTSFRDWCADRITIGWIVRYFWPGEEIQLGPTHCYVIRHERLVWYMRDPYSLKDSSDDPRKQWGPIRQAWRFPSQAAAENCMMWQELSGVIEKIPLH